MSVTETISSEYLGFLVRDLDGPATAPEGTITWGHEFSFYRTLDSQSLYTSNAGSAFQTEYYDATTNESLVTSSVFTQTFAGTPVGMISGVETYHRTYEGGYSIAFLMYGGMQSWNYNGTDSWTWEDPGLSTFDPELLEEVPMRPLGTPQASPHSFAVPSATRAVWMPPAIFEDPDAAAAEEGGGLTIEGILISLIPGSSLYDAYQNWQKSQYGSFVFNGLTGIWDVATMGAVSKGKALIKSGGRAIYGVLDSTVKGLKGLVEEGIQLASGKVDDGGKLPFAAYVPKSLKEADDGMKELAKARNTLRQNLGENPFPVSAEAHHILPVERWNSKAAEKLRKWKIDLNGKDNGVWLPKVHYEGRTATLHKMHTRDYGDMVVRLLMQAKNRKEGKQVLLKIKQGLLDGTIQL